MTHLDLARRNQEARRLHKRLGRDAEAQERIERGWPHLRILDDKRGSAKAAQKALQAIDPHTGPVWPRETAVRYVQAFAGGETAPPDSALLRQLIERSFCSVLGYPFAHADALWIFEALLGADVVAGEFAAALTRAPAEVWTWDNPNHRLIAQVTALGWILLRATPSARDAALGEIQAVHPRNAKPLSRAVDFLVGAAEPDLNVEWERRLRVVHQSAALARARIAHPWRLWICDPQDLWVAEVAPPEWALASLAKEPRWFPEHLEREWEPFDHTFTTALCRRERPEKLNKKQLDAAVAELFARLIGELKKARGKPSAESEIAVRAAMDLVILRSRAGDPTPDFHIGHILGVDGWSKKLPSPLQSLGPSEEELTRWMEAISNALR